MTKKIILITIIIIGIGFVIYQGFIKKTEPSFDLAEVTRGELFQKVSETGIVKKGGELNLGFKNSEAGRLEKIYIKVGDEVKFGQRLAKIEINQLQIQVQEAKASLAVSQAKLDQILAGVSKEEIQVAETVVENAEIALNNSKVSLKNIEQSSADTKADAENDLNQAYEDAWDIFNSSYTTADKALLRTFNEVQEKYFISSDQLGLRVREAETKALSAFQEADNNEDIDSAITKLKTALSQIRDALVCIREAMDEPQYKNTVSAVDRTGIDTERVNIDAAAINLTTAQQTVSLTKIANQTSINNAQANLDTAQSSLAVAEGNLKSAQDKLAQIKAPARQEDINLYQAQVNQSQAKVNLLENQIVEAVLKTPIDGQITKVNKKPGELIQPPDVVVALLPSVPFEIETNIYEEDIVKTNIGNPVDISLIAFPDQIFKGKVISIDPSEKIIEGVVYYKIIIAFGEMPKKVKPGMTADLVIKTAQKENVLMVIEEAIQEKDNKVFVEVFKDGAIEKREIETGILGSDGMTEIIYGLTAGEKVILR